MKTFPSLLEGIYDLEREHITHLLSLARNYKQKFLEGRPFSEYKYKRPERKTVITYFTEHSTRTKISFIQAIRYLGLGHINFDVELSSVKKGETLKETLLTLEYNHCDLLVYRTHVPKEFSAFREDPPFAIINAGDGINQHPTQALLDLLTLKENNLGPEGKTVAIIGDCRHSRVCHSLIEILNLFDAKVLLVGPEEFIPQITDDNVEVTHDLSYALEKADILYPLRIQLERHNSSLLSISPSDYHQEYGLSLSRLKNKQIPVLHAGPANIGVEISQDLIDSELYYGHKQVQHAIFMRMAIIATMLKMTPFGGPYE